MLFGMHLFETGIKRYPIRNRSEIIQYTYQLRRRSHEKLTMLIRRLVILNLFRYVFVHPALLDTITFLYRKIGLIKSKVGMAFTPRSRSSVSLTMTDGHLFLLWTVKVFPLFSHTSRPGERFGAHKKCCLDSVTSRPKEGWSITKESTFGDHRFFTFGLFTFVPAIQEFCIFAIVGLITDFFLQMFFFLTILGIDIGRMVSSIEKTNQNFRNTLYQTQNIFDKTHFKLKGMNRSKSHPRLSSFPANIVAGQAQGEPREKDSKTAISSINTSWNSAVEDKQTNGLFDIKNYSSIKLFPLLNTNHSIQVNYVTYNPLDVRYHQNETQDTDKLRHSDYAPWLKLSSRHWPSILKKYNMSLGGQVIAVMPNIKLSPSSDPIRRSC
ncbi:hypothetical protein NQ317_012893 [Molorchus minor]|uniref:SSD domain-containing protein n=1 Tax=Molorchus minor TaxID=1323400 RepID=A0ABQ9JPX9_9CUCU|nr:hypothetical protein NQ317_012893 [Molorchus minor]